MGEPEGIESVIARAGHIPGFGHFAKVYQEVNSSSQS
jgi:hypothetical protein